MDLNEQANELIDKLTFVKEGFMKAQNELSVSIRKDLVAVQLKEMLTSNPDYSSLKNALEDYIEDLYKLDKENKDGKGDN